MSISQQMVDIDSRLSISAMNWNHNLAHVFRNFDKFKDGPKFARVFKNWDSNTANDWLSRGSDSGAIDEIRAIDSDMASAIINKIKEIDVRVLG